MNMLEVAKIIRSFLNWMYKLFNALGITAFNDTLSNAMGELE